MRRFDQIFLFFVLLNISILWANFTGIFPEHWNPLVKQIEEMKQAFNQSIARYSSLNIDIFTQLGGLAYLTLQSILLILQVFLGAPYYVNLTLKNIIHPYDNMFGIFIDGLMLINYVVFIVWIVDIIRGVRITGW